MIAILSPQTIIIALVIGVASGAIGAFIILRRMALVGDALSHVALPGIGLALAYNIDPFWGVFSFCVLAAILVWLLVRKTTLHSETVVGLLFTVSLAIGILTIPDTEILESLFGAFTPLSPFVFFFITGAGIMLIALTFLFARRFLLSTISPDFAHIEAAKRSKLYELALLVIFSCIVALGIKLVGTLLMGALTIIPASIAKNISRSIGVYIAASAFLGGLISLAGAMLAARMNVIPGPTIIILGIALFALSLFWAKRI